MRSPKKILEVKKSARFRFNQKIEAAHDALVGRKPEISVALVITRRRKRVDAKKFSVHRERVSPKSRSQINREVKVGRR